MGENSVVLKIWTRLRPLALYSPHKVLILRTLLEHYSVVQQEICDLRPLQFTPPLYGTARSAPVGSSESGYAEICSFIGPPLIVAHI